jgi:hypothetical protein
VEPIPSKTGIVSRNFAAYLKWGGVGRNGPGNLGEGSVKGAAMRMKKVGGLDGISLREREARGLGARRANKITRRRVNTRRTELERREHTDEANPSKSRRAPETCYVSASKRRGRAGPRIKGANVNLAAVNVRGLAHQLGSWSRRDAHRRRRWLLLAAAWALSGCTLTNDAFEPDRVDSVGGELNPEPSGEPLPSPDERAPVSSASDDDSSGSSVGDSSDSTESSGNGEGSDLGSVPLDPPESGGGDLPSGTNAGQSGNERADAGGDPDLGNDNPEVDEGPEVDESPEVDAPPDLPVTAPCRGMEFGGSCYQVFAERVAWAVAEQRCVALGAHLASVQSFQEDAFLDGWPAQLGLAVGDGSGVWLGGSDTAVDGDFRWWDSSPLSFVGWAPNQPDDGAGSDCIEKRNDGNGLWYDRRCTDALAFVCERPL